MQEQNTQLQTEQAAPEFDLESDQPLTPVCPLNPGDGECEACQ